VGTLVTGGVVTAGVVGVLGTVTRGTVTGLTVGVTGAGRPTGSTAAGADLGAERFGAARGLGGVFKAGVAGTGVTATILTWAAVDRVEGASCAWGGVADLVAAPAANAIPNATIGAANSSSSFRPDTPIAYGSLGALMPLAINRSLIVDPAITRSPSDFADET
jgi:hypothetical protein